MPVREMKKFRYVLVVGIILLDQAVKLLVRTAMYVGQSFPVLADFFHITYVQNRGAAFSILSGKFLLLVGVPAAAVIFALWYMEKHIDCHWTLMLSLCLIISGGIGNLIDRVIMGFVTDMFDFGFFPVFNVADIAVCVGAGFLILYTFWFSEKEQISGSNA